MMKLDSPQIISSDVLVIGGGGAGLRAAIEAKRQGVDVLVASRSRVGYGSNTTISGGGFAAVLSHSRGDSRDSPEQHLLDTVSGGCYLSDQALAEIMVRGAEQQVEDLYKFGVRYAAPSSPWIALSSDPGHSHLRLVYSHNAFGTGFTLPLRRYAQSQEVRFLEGVVITKLLKSRGRAVGAVGIDNRGRALVLAAQAVVLATGGLGQVYRRHDNVAGATGDGYALAYEAGAVLQDMEFVQFYPTSLGGGTPALFYECLLAGTGGRLLNRLGEDIAEKHGLNEPMLLTRDRLSQAIAKEIASGLGFGEKVVLELKEVSHDSIEILAPVLPKEAIGRRRFLVAPAVHFHMGGVKIDQRAETFLRGLYAAGEVCGGIHGANRLGGNALTEVWVWGTIAGREAARRAREVGPAMPKAGIAGELERLQQVASGEDGEKVEALHRSLKETMWHQAGVIRDAGGLKQALEHILHLKKRYNEISVADGKGLQHALKLGSMLTVSEMICRAALYRKESRGAHCRRDFPGQENKWLCHILMVKKGKRLALSTRPVKLTRLSPPA